MLNEEDLRHLQQCELVIANEVKRICEKHNIKYFMVGGTMLGAVRHKGFIPWDDDMDFGMERKEYDRFCRICKTELDDRFVLQTWDTDSDYPFSFGKVRMRNTYVKELFAPPKESECGIFIDIFPHDNAPDDKKLRKQQSRKYFFYKRALWIKKGYGKNIKRQGVKQLVKYYVFATVCTLIPYKWLKQKFDITMRKYNGQVTKELVGDGTYSYMKSMKKRTWLHRVKDYRFENDVFPGFEEYDMYLKREYGDYMTLPEPEERHSHDISSVEFAQ